MAVGPALSLARCGTIPRKTACLALEQDGLIGLLGSFAAAVTKAPADGEEEHCILIIRRWVKYR